MEFIPERLTELRTAQGITRAEAARRLNMSAMGYGRYERGERTPSFQTVSYMAQVFNTSTDYLFGLSEDSHPSSITIRSSDDPDLFSLIETAKTNPSLRARLMAYAKLLGESQQDE